MNADTVIRELSVIIDPFLAQSSIDSYVEMQQRFLSGDWTPVELNGGRICESVARSFYQLDSNSIRNDLLPGKIVELLTDGNTPHKLSKPDRAHVSKVISMIYKLRSDRGAVHISPTHNSNFMDSMLVIHSSKWLIAELLRLSLKKDLKFVGETIEQLVQLEHPLIHEIDGKPLVLALKITAPDEILLLLHHAPNNRLSRSSLHAQAKHQSQSNLNQDIVRLEKLKQIRLTGDGDWLITPPGQNRVLKSIMPRYAQRF